MTNPIAALDQKAHSVTRHSESLEASDYRVWLTCRCGWSSGDLPNGNLPTVRAAEFGHYEAIIRTRVAADIERMPAAYPRIYDGKRLVGRRMAARIALGGNA